MPNNPLASELDAFIPLDKSWLMRMGLLDLVHGRDETVKILQAETGLSDDLLALKRALESWKHTDTIDVGESGTLNRFLQFLAWKRGEKREFIKHGSLKNRAITSDPLIVHSSLVDLLKLDNGTSQWASAAVLLGNGEPKPRNMPYKLQLTYDALAAWEQAHATGKMWHIRRDETIARQAKAYTDYLQTGAMDFTPLQAEDYCFARAFGLMTATEGEAKWSALRQHESDRIAEVEKAVDTDFIVVADHRVVQAVAMARNFDQTHFKHPGCVNKSWAKFWDFIGYTKHVAEK